MPFAWGNDRNDCVSYAAAAVKATTGRIVDFGGSHWTTARGAARVLKSFGGLEAAVDLHLTRVSVSFAQRGDIAAVSGKHGLLLMIVEGDTLAGPAAAGTMRLPRTAALIAWSAD